MRPASYQQTRAMLLSFLVVSVCLSAARIGKADDIPGGSYQQSCQDIRVDSGTLFADCRTRDGGTPATNLPGYQQCIGDISNQDGSLRCNKGSQIPTGSYKNSCRDIWVDQFSTLHASCRHPSGAWIDGVALSHFNACVGDIFNFNGLLQCSRGTLPAGSYRDSCEEISIDANASVLVARCRNFGGALVGATLNTKGCLRGIYNVDGNLTCERGPSAAPDGSYKKTCKDLFADGTTLNASCRMSNGRFVPTAFDYHICAHVSGEDIANLEGTLGCVAVQPPPRSTPCGVPPSGGNCNGVPFTPPSPPSAHPVHAEAFHDPITTGETQSLNLCKEGFVWRDAVPGDHVCVAPSVRAQVIEDNAAAPSRRQPGGGASGPDTCRAGFVWREAIPADHVCVTPQTHSLTAADNKLASERRASN